MRVFFLFFVLIEILKEMVTNNKITHLSSLDFFPILLHSHTQPSFTPFTGGTQVPPYPLLHTILFSFLIFFLILLPLILILIVLYLTILLQTLHMRVIQYNSVCMVNHLPPEVSPYGLVLKPPTPLVQ